MPQLRCQWKGDLLNMNFPIENQDVPAISVYLGVVEELWLVWKTWSELVVSLRWEDMGEVHQLRRWWFPIYVTSTAGEILRAYDILQMGGSSTN